MVKIIKDFLPSSQKKQRPGYAMNPKYITVHNTANANKGANAEMHSRYLHNGASGRSVGWHYTVDDKEVYQHLPTNENGWHAGDGSNGTGNRQSIGVEICENKDGDFEQAVENAQTLIKQLMKEHNIPLSNVVPHKKWTGKNCPRLLLNRWDEFIAGIDESKTYTPPKKQTTGTTVKKATGAIATIQSTLNSRYGFNIAVDNIFGQETKKALVKAYQIELNKQFNAGLVVDGIHGRKTYNAGVTVRKGAKGNLTWILQAMLRCKGYKLSVDGIFGSETERVVKQFQRAEKIAADGVPGKITFGRLFG